MGMLKAYTNKYNSYQAIQGTLEDNRSLYEDNHIMKELVDEFMELKEEIIRVAGESDHKTNEMTREKYRLKEEMAEKAYALASAGIVYAIDVDDPELKSLLSANYSKIKYAKDAESFGYASGIEKTLRKHIDRLGDYMITVGELDDLRSVIGKYDDLLQTRGVAKVTAVAARKQLTELYDRMDELLNERLDRFMHRLAVDHPEFGKLYFQNRKIYDR